MNEEGRIPFVLLLVGVLGLLATAAGVLAAPAWAWLAVIAMAIGHSLLWRAAGVRRVSAAERRKHERAQRNAAVRDRNAAKRERRIIRIARRTEDRVKEVLARGVDVSWAEKTAGAVRELQGIAERHEAALQAHKMLTDRTMEQLGSMFQQERLERED